MAKEKRPVKSLRADTANINKCFIIIFFICAFFSMEIAILTRGRTLEDSLFWNGAYSDHFMDLINTLRDSHDLSWVYQRNVIYPPLSVLFTYLLSLIIPKELAATAFSQRLTVQSSAVVILIIFIFIALTVVSICKMIDIYMAKTVNMFERICICLFTALSFPMIYCLERGNLSVLALIGCMFFIFFRNSENKYVREISYILLALAAGIKLFPAALGVLLIYDKKYKAAVRTVIYGVCALILPYLLIKVLTPASGGLADAVQSQLAAGETLPGTKGEVNTNGSIARFAQNIMSWFSKKTYFTLNSTSSSNLIYAASLLVKSSGSHVNPIAFCVFAATEILAFILGFFCKREWQRVFIAVYLMLNIHSISMHYTLVYLIPVLIVFLCEKNDAITHCRKKSDFGYLALLCLIIAPLPNLIFSADSSVVALFSIYLSTATVCNFNKIFSCLAFQLIFILIIFEVLNSLRKNRKNKKEAKKAEAPVPQVC